MQKPNPFTTLWDKYDKLLTRDKENHENDTYFKSGYEPLYHEQGVFSNGRLNINLSSLYTFLIQKIGKYCDYYASDFLITYDSLKRLIENTCPDTPTTYRFIGIRESGVDDVAYVLSRLTQDNPSVLASYYRKLYGLRIKHEGLDHSPKHAAYVHIELRDFSGEIYSLADKLQKENYKVDDYYHPSDHEKCLNVLQDLHTMQNLIRILNDYRDGILEQLHNIKDKPQKNYFNNIQVELSILNNCICSEIQEISNCIFKEDTSND